MHENRALIPGWQAGEVRSPTSTRHPAEASPLLSVWHAGEVGALISQTGMQEKSEHAESRVQQLTKQVEDLQLQVEVLQSEQQAPSHEPARGAAQEAVPSQPVRSLMFRVWSLGWRI